MSAMRGKRTLGEIAEGREVEENADDQHGDCHERPVKHWLFVTSDATILDCCSIPETAHNMEQSDQARDDENYSLNHAA